MLFVMNKPALAVFEYIYIYIYIAGKISIEHVTIFS